MLSDFFGAQVMPTVLLLNHDSKLKRSSFSARKDKENQQTMTFKICISMNISGSILMYKNLFN